jgi:hypothetical protein
MYALGPNMSPGGLASQGFADGGRVSAHKFARGSGLFSGSAPGRADTVSTMLLPGGHVVPADVVAGLGEGNTAAGAKRLQHSISRAPKVKHTAHGATPVKVSSGEFYIHPAHVAALGGGDLDKGHEALRQMAAHVRQNVVQHATTVDAPR